MPRTSLASYRLTVCLNVCLQYVEMNEDVHVCMSIQRNLCPYHIMLSTNSSPSHKMPVGLLCSIKCSSFLSVCISSTIMSATCTLRIVFICESLRGFFQ